MILYYTGVQKAFTMMYAYEVGHLYMGGVTTIYSAWKHYPVARSFYYYQGKTCQKIIVYCLLTCLALIVHVRTA